MISLMQAASFKLESISQYQSIGVKLRNTDGKQFSNRK